MFDFDKLQPDWDIVENDDDYQDHTHTAEGDDLDIQFTIEEPDEENAAYTLSMESSYSDSVFGLTVDGQQISVVCMGENPYGDLQRGDSMALCLSLEFKTADEFVETFERGAAILIKAVKQLEDGYLVLPSEGTED